MAGALLEREPELAAVDDALDAAMEGDGAAVLVEGGPGAGKTELLRVAVGRARERELTVLRARGGELERAFAFGVLRQLLEPTLDAPAATRERLLAGAAAHAAPAVDPRATGGAADVGAVVHGAYWLLSNLVAERPGALIVDDVHWSDPVSVRWLLYLVRRLEGLPVAVFAAARPSEPGAEVELLDALRSSDGVRLVEPAPLSEAAIDALARHALGDSARPGVAAALLAATGGVPLFVVEALRALREGGIDDPARIEELGATAVGRFVRDRLRRMGPEAQSVAESVALLEPHARLADVAALAQVAIPDAAAHADALLAAGMVSAVDPARFVHPVVRAAVADGVPPAERGLRHRDAARLLDARQVPAGVVAAHLLRAPPAGEPETVAALRRAAAEALSAGAADAASVALQRALAEPPAADARLEVLVELGVAEGRAAMYESAATRLREVLRSTHDDELSGQAAVALVTTLCYAGDVVTASQLGFEMADQLPAAHPLAPVLEAMAIVAGIPAGRGREVEERVAALAGASPDGGPLSPMLTGAIAFLAMMREDPRERVLACARAALVGGALAFDPAAYFGTEAPALVRLWSDDLDGADALLEQAVEASRAAGSVGAVAYFAGFRAYAAFRRGDLRRAAADLDQAQAAMGAISDGSFPGLAVLMAGGHLLREQGRPADAVAMIAGAPLPLVMEHLPLTAFVRHAQGAAQLAAGDPATAAATLRRVGAAFLAASAPTPVVAPWRSDLARALWALGERDEALALANEEVERARRTQCPRAIGIALRVRGTLAGEQDDLRNAVEVLDRSPARLEHARARLALGAAMRRGNERRAAREHLERALDLAQACGSEPLVNESLEELRAAGARPRRLYVSGSDSLTPSELRVCRLAAEGRSNPEIAQTLFVTRKTVETHLSHAFRKLDVTQREQLTDALPA